MNQASTRPVAIVTGAASGIGKGCALAFARAGFNLLLGDMNQEGLERLRPELAALGADSLAVAANIANLDKHQAMLEAAVERWGRIDCLLNNAGVTVMQRGDLLEATPESFDRCINVNTRAVFFLSQRVARWMIEQGEIGGQNRSIINIKSSNATMASISGRISFGMFSVGSGVRLSASRRRISSCSVARSSSAWRCAVACTWPMMTSSFCV